MCINSDEEKWRRDFIDVLDSDEETGESVLYKTPAARRQITVESLVVAEEEFPAILERVGEASRMVRNFKAFLDEFCVTTRQPAPGRWRYSH